MTEYTVARGDTLGKIAKRFYGDAGRFPLIVSANDISNPDRLEVGRVLRIPDAETAARALPGASVLPVAVSDRTQRLNEQRLASLHPSLAIRGRALVDLCAQAGLALLVTQGLRTFEEQDALFAQGRTKPGKKVTNARAGQSYHNYGLAFDVVVLDSVGKADWDDSHPGWALAGKLGKSVGLEWGGSWTRFKDTPHFQYNNGLSVQDCRRLHAQGGINGVWARIA